MTAPLFDSLPTALTSLGVRPLLAMRLQVDGPTILGRGPAHDRRIGIITGGQFDGPHEGLSGTVLPGGSDWQTVRADGTWTLDVRLVLKANAGDLIGVTYRGYRRGPPEVLARLARGESVDPSEYYFRSTPLFETASERFAWLNGIVAVGIGHRFPDGPVYSLFEIL